MRVQIVYGSRRGGTAGLAHMIATAFEREGWDVAIGDVTNRPGIGDVDLLVVGGPLYMNRWPSDLRDWVKHHMSTLRSVPVWMFSSGPLDDSARAGDIAPVPSVAKIAREIEIAGHMTFGGYLDPHPSGLVARVMARSNSGDWRDAEHVAEWVHYICRQYAVVEAVPRQRSGEPVLLPDAEPAVEASVPKPRAPRKTAATHR